MANTLILGLGNPLRGDDGVGTAVITTLQNEPLPPDVDVVDGGTAGLELVLLLQKYRRVLVVDAAEMGLAPGEWRRFDGNTAVLPTNPDHLNGTLHNAGFAQALTLAEALGTLPTEITVFGVQPAMVDWSDGLRAAVETAVLPVCQAVLGALGE